MGQRGPAPKPATLRVLSGETRPSQIARAPKPTDPPTKPAGLDAEASRVWDRILAVTDHIGEAHAETLRQYCEATSALNAWKPKGTKEWRDLANVHRQLARELCLTPATGANLAPRRSATANPLDKYLRRSG